MRRTRLTALTIGWLAAAATATAAVYAGVSATITVLLVFVVGFCATLSALWSR